MTKVRLFSHSIESFDGYRVFFQTNFDPELERPSKCLVFNYGLVCSDLHWKYLYPYLDSIGWKFILHDYRGHHQSQKLHHANDMNFTNIAKDIDKILAFLKQESCVLLGHSMGVNISLEFAHLYPEKALALVLISGSLVPPQGVMFHSSVMNIVGPAWEWLHDTFPEPFLKLWESSKWNPLAIQFVRLLGFNPEKTNYRYVKNYLENVSNLSPQVFFQGFKLMREHDIISKVSDIKIPALIIGGDKDLILPIDLQKELANSIKNGELYILKDGSHVPQIDFPQYTHERVELFLSQHTQ